MKHITWGVNRALDIYGPGNILRELAKRADRKEIEKLETEKAQLVAQVAAMTQEPSQKSEEIRRYHAEQTVVFSWIWQLVEHSGEFVNKAHHYDRMMESSYPSSARQTLPILAKYSRMKRLLAEIHKVVPLSGTPKRVLYPGPPGSPTGTMYKVVGEVALVQTSPVGARPCQLGRTSHPTSSGRASDRVVYRDVMTGSCRHDATCRVGPLRHDTIGSS